VYLVGTDFGQQLMIRFQELADAADSSRELYTSSHGMSIDFDLPMFVLLLLVTTPEVSVEVLDVQIRSLVPLCKERPVAHNNT
jgi:hypothetical protein